MSRSMRGMGPKKPHLLQGEGGLAAEIQDLRDDTGGAFGNLETELDAYADIQDEDTSVLTGKFKLNFTGVGVEATLDGVDPLKVNVAVDGAAVGSASPLDVGTTDVGVATTASREDHVHAHGDQLGGTLHADVVAAGDAGFMSGADKTKLDGVEAGATNTPLGSATPEPVGTAAVGVATDVSREDHVHAHGDQLGGTLHADVVAAGDSGFMSGADKTKLDGVEAGATNTPLGSATPEPVGTAAVGVATDVSREDHVHAHGDQLGGTLHADVVAAGDSGFMSGADKTKLDGVEAGATNTPLGSATPEPVGTAAVGVATDVSREDHVHAHGDQLGGTLHADVVAAGDSGFMSGADKTKLDGVASGATNTPLGSATPEPVGTAAVGTAGNASHEDHVHGHGDQLGGTLHAVAAAGGDAGFMSGADKTKLDQVHTGANTPEGAVTAPIGDIFLQNNGGIDTCLWSKESGAGNTGWKSAITLQVGDTASRPTTRPVGCMYFDTTEGFPVWWDGSDWVDATGTPT